MSQSIPNWSSTMLSLYITFVLDIVTYLNWFLLVRVALSLSPNSTLVAPFFFQVSPFVVAVYTSGCTTVGGELSDIGRESISSFRSKVSCVVSLPLDSLFTVFVVGL